MHTDLGRLVLAGTSHCHNCLDRVTRAAFVQSESIHTVVLYPVAGDVVVARRIQVDAVVKRMIFILRANKIKCGEVVMMQKTIEVVYENGVFKPLHPVELIEGGKAKVTIEKEKGIITSEDVKELKEAIESLPKLKISLKKLDEIYNELQILRHKENSYL